MSITQVNYNSVGKFLLSMGIIIVVSVISLLFYFIKLIPEEKKGVVLNIVFILYTVGAVIGGALSVYGFLKFKSENKKIENLNFETKLNYILDQELKFIELKSKCLDYNIKIEVYNKNREKGKKDKIKIRNFSTIAEQALDDEFYTTKNKKAKKPKYYKTIIDKE